MAVFDNVQRLLAVLGADHLIACLTEVERQQLQLIWFVISYENFDFKLRVTIQTPAPQTPASGACLKTHKCHSFVKVLFHYSCIIPDITGSSTAKQFVPSVSLVIISLPR